MISLTQNIDFIVHLNIIDTLNKFYPFYIKTESSGCFELLWIRFGSYQIKKTGHCVRFGLAAVFSTAFWQTLLLEFDFVCLDSDFVRLF